VCWKGQWIEQSKFILVEKGGFQEVVENVRLFQAIEEKSTAEIFPGFERGSKL